MSPSFANVSRTWRHLAIDVDEQRRHTRSGSAFGRSRLSLSPFKDTESIVFVRSLLRTGDGPGSPT